MYKVTLPIGLIKTTTAVLMKSNKLFNTINICSTGILVKSQDLDLVFRTLEKLEIKINVKKVV